jgi:hypothetical protein
MSAHFITFGAGHQKYIEAGERLLAQANSLNLFQKTTLYTDAFLKNDTEFWYSHHKFIKKYAKGYGLWLWKPYVIKCAMNDLQDGDILLYLDCGCELDIRKRDKLAALFEVAKQDYIVGSFIDVEKDWTKKDLILEMDMNKAEYLETPQHQGGVLLFYVCDLTRDLVNKWYTLACGNDYHNIDETPSICDEDEDFKEHRHDQSIFSLLSKKYKLFSEKSLATCVNISRNRSGVTQIVTGDTNNLLLKRYVR